MVAKVRVPVDYDLAAICEAAGQPDPDKRSYGNSFLHVKDVEQAALEAAVLAYDHLANVKEKAKKSLKKQAKAFVYNGFDLEDVLAVAIGEGEAGDLDALKAKVKDGKARLQVALAAVDAATSVKDVEKVKL